VGEPPEISRRWKRDLRNAIQLSQKDFPTLDDLNGCIEIAEDLSWIRNIPEGSTIAIDYETTGLKPWADGHRIVAVGIALSENQAIAALVDQSDPEQIQLLRGLLTNDRIEKIAHNMKFEEMWSRVQLNCEVKGWKWDTMIAAHILDNRTGITSLKFQAYVQFGIPNYDELVAPFLSPSGDSNRGANSKNRIELLLRSPEKTRELLKYCGMDALLTYRLAQVQISQISQSPSLSKAYRLFHRGAMALENMEQNGIAIATEECEKLKNELSQTIDRLTNELIQSEFGQQWKAFIGPSKFNINSSDQLSKFLYEFKKIPPPKLTTSGKGSTDDEVLRELKIPELDKILEIRKLKKIRDTYLDQFLREQCGGILHPFFQLHTTRTYRSSSDHPNFQNLPKRDPDTMKICRSVIYPRPGRQFLSMDFSGIEVRIACVYTQDERLIKDTLSGDMHRDMAIELFLLDSLDKHDPNESRLRQAAKNSFVFPQFYGDYYVNCARNLIKWATDSRLKDGTPALEHLERKGLVRLDRRGNLISFDRFEQHVKKVEDAFWNERYRTYSAWKERMWRNYIKNGYVEMLTGFRCSGLMDRKQVSNYPIQGTAFHCLLWVLIEFDQLLKQNKKQSRLVSQVHDEVTVECPPEELQWCAKVLKRLAEKKLPQQWNWINVPLEVEFEICNVGEPLSMKRHWDLNKIS
jgi:DNA polymerase-1